MPFRGDYLRVMTPLTSDGLLPITVNGQLQYREDHLPLTARKMLEAKNAKLPESLRKIITVVENRPYSTAELNPTFNQPPAQQTSQQTSTVKNKGGRPPKSKK